MKTKLHILYFLTVFSNSLIAQKFTQLTTGLKTGSSPKEMTCLNNKIIFSATTASDGNELWISDGTKAGTKMLKDIYPDSININPNSSSATGFTLFNNKLYFVANDKESRDNLWETDGTEAGTKKVLNKRIEARNWPMTILNGKFLLKIDSAGFGTELFSYDPLTNNLILLKDIYPGGSSGFNSSSLGIFNIVGNKAYFGATSGLEGAELFVTDGTPSGTTIVKDINTGKRDAWPFGFGILNNKLLFTAINFNAAEASLWVTDGTDAGTIEISKMKVNRSNFPTSPVNYKGKIYFQGYDTIGNWELWQTDGTTNGTVEFMNIRPDPYRKVEILDPSYPQQLNVFNDKLYFSASDGDNRLLWQSDGTKSGTFKVKNNYSNLKNLHSPSNFYHHNGFLYFISESDSFGTALCQYNGIDSNSFKILTPDSAKRYNPFFIFDYELWRNFASCNNDLYLVGNYKFDSYNLWKIADLPTSIETIENKSNFKTYPNPNKGSFKIKNNEIIGNIFVYNSMGQIIYQTKTNEIEIDLNIDKPGIYIIQIINGNLIQTQKVIIQN